MTLSEPTRAALQTSISAEWIAVDWGTSNMRAWAMGQGDAVLARTANGKGMGQLRPEAFEDALIEAVGDWLSEDRRIPVIACGMVGARQGWIEAPYAQVPTTPIAATMTRAPANDPRIEVVIVPGVCQRRPADVMRGEETQIAGYVALKGDRGIICMPGTHSKWAEVEGGEIKRFRGAMTGEIFALLAEQSVLRHSVAGDEWDDGEFASGVETALEDPAILTQLFSIRARSLLGGTGAGASRARLSGLLIGSELAGTPDFWRQAKVSLIGAPKLAPLYSQGLAIAGGEAEMLDGEDMTLAGLCAARRALGETEK